MYQVVGLPKLGVTAVANSLIEPVGERCLAKSSNIFIKANEIIK